MAWMNHKKSRVMETMRSFDKNNTGFIENKRFINGVIDSGFDTNEREMRKVGVSSSFKLFIVLGG